MTIPNNVIYKLFGLAGTGAAMLGINLEDALCTDPAELARTIAAYLNRLTTTTPAVAVEEPAVICQPPRAPLPVPAAQAEKWKPAPPSLTRPGDILEAPEDIDWDDPALYV